VGRLVRGRAPSSVGGVTAFSEDSGAFSVGSDAFSGGTVSFFGVTEPFVTGSSDGSETFSGGTVTFSSPSASPVPFPTGTVAAAGSLPIDSSIAVRPSVVSNVAVTLTLDVRTATVSPPPNATPHTNGECEEADESAVPSHQFPSPAPFGCPVRAALRRSRSRPVDRCGRVGGVARIGRSVGGSRPPVDAVLGVVGQGRRLPVGVGRTVVFGRFRDRFAAIEDAASRDPRRERPEQERRRRTHRDRDRGGGSKLERDVDSIRGERREDRGRSADRVDGDAPELVAAGSIGVAELVVLPPVSSIELSDEPSVDSAAAAVDAPRSSRSRTTDQISVIASRPNGSSTSMTKPVRVPAN